MAIASMQKVMIVAHRSQASDLLSVLQDAGIVQLLNAERAMVSKEWPELMVEIKRHREQEELIDRLRKAIDFLNPYAPREKTSLLAPLIEVDSAKFRSAVAEDPIYLLKNIESLSADMERVRTETETQTALLERLHVWQPLRIPLEDFASLRSSSVFIGLIGDQYISELKQKLTTMGAAFDTIAQTNHSEAAVIVALHENASDVQKVLRAYEFEPALFEGLTGTIDDNITNINKNLDDLQIRQDELRNKAFELAKNKLKLQILYDYYQNLHGRIQAESSAPATNHAIFFEGWVKWRDYQKMQKIVAGFNACDVAPIEAAEDEEPPVEIDNGPMSEPFETVTRLYGMPAATDIDPTVFLAPFFALFFGICLTDAAYGLVMLGLMWWLRRKIKGDRKFIIMMIFCSITTVIAGALTGGWFGDMVQKFELFNGGTPETSDTVFEKFRSSVMWFDPLIKPMYFFNISLGLGYLQIITGVFIGFVHKYKRGEKRNAIFDHLSWFIWLNCLLVFGLGKAGILPDWLSRAAGVSAILPALMILLFSVREGSWGGRIGMGLYNLFSTVFYIGDVLSYIRLMALGMVTAGFGMAINEIVRKVMEMGVMGWVLGAVIFIGGHLFNIANSALGSFVHSMRLQFVEFFTKFLSGGGRQFDPLKQSYRYIDVKEK